MLALMLIGIARCASAQLCPEDKALISAVRSRNDARLFALSAQAAAEDPYNFTTFHIEGIKSISDVICGDALPEELPTITCKFTVRYWSTNAYQVARLIKEDGIWKIDQALTVSRKRR